jgi:hypothetical protein
VRVGIPAQTLLLNSLLCLIQACRHPRSEGEAMSDILEAAARIVFDRDDLSGWDRRAEGATEWAVEVEREDYRATARAVLAAVAPLIRAAALEEAAAAAETRDLGDNSAQDGLAQEIAAAIRALAGRPADPT